MQTNLIEKARVNRIAALASLALNRGEIMPRPGNSLSRPDCFARWSVKKEESPASRGRWATDQVFAKAG